MSDKTETPAVTPENLDRWENERIPKAEARGVVNALIAEVRRLTAEAAKPKRQTRKPKVTPAEVPEPEPTAPSAADTGGDD